MEAGRLDLFCNVQKTEGRRRSDEVTTTATVAVAMLHDFDFATAATTTMAR